VLELPTVATLVEELSGKVAMLNKRLLISFAKQSVWFDGQKLFPTHQRMRFEWFALLAYKRVNQPSDQSSVSASEIARLPSWRGRGQRHIRINVGRYLRSTELARTALVVADKPWAGPYKLDVQALSIRFDVPLNSARQKLNLDVCDEPMSQREELLRFALLYARAQSLFFRGSLLPHAKENGPKINARDLLMSLVRSKSYNPTLRSLACLAAAELQYRIGDIAEGLRILFANERLFKGTPDLSIKAQFYLKQAWRYQRASSGKTSDREVKRALGKAAAVASASGDRMSLGLLAYRTGLFLTKKAHHEEAISQLIMALEAFLITGNFDMVQSACGNIGSVIHRLGVARYEEARRWLLTSMAIARWTDVGRDDAHAEMILGKIYVESKKPKKRLSWLLLKRAERIAAHAGNAINLADTKMVQGFWHKRFGNSRKQYVATLAEALRVFESLPLFDRRQKKKYMAQSFEKVWDDALDCAGITNAQT
jgi:hypothetical protein